MPRSANFGRTGVLGGLVFGNSNQSVVTAEAEQTRVPTVAQAKSGVLSTRTDDNTGIATLSGGHGVQSGDRVDVYWTGGSRRGMDATVSTNAVTVDGGNGDALPLETTEVVVAICDEETHVVSGDDVKAILLESADARGTFVFAADDDSEIYAVTLDAGGVFHWWDGCGLANPLASASVAKVFLTHDDASAAQDLKIGILHD